MKLLYFKLFLFVLGSLFLCGFIFDKSPDYQIKIRVIDESNDPVESASVLVMYYDRSSKFIFRHEFGTVIGTTDRNGVYVYNGFNGKDIVEYHIWKDGYYSTLSEFSFPEYGPFGSAKSEYKTFLLRPIKNPLIFGKDFLIGERCDSDTVWKKIPVLGEEVGFDIIERAWVKPFGKGIIPDIYVKITKSINVDKVDFAKAEIRFANKNDGIQEIAVGDIKKCSIFETPRTAPSSGYINKLEFYHPATENGYNELRAFSLKRDKNFYYKISNYIQTPWFYYPSLSGYFYIRIRDGKHYGIIKGNIEFGNIIRSDTAELRATLFMNPNISQNNIEFIRDDPRGPNPRFQRENK